MMRGRRIRNFVAPGRGANRNSNGDKPGSGPGSYCVCLNCGYRVSHTRAEPCNNKVCPKCGSKLTKA